MVHSENEPNDDTRVKAKSAQRKIVDEMRDLAATCGLSSDIELMTKRDAGIVTGNESRYREGNKYRGTAGNETRDTAGKLEEVYGVHSRRGSPLNC